MSDEDTAAVLAMLDERVSEEDRQRGAEAGERAELERRRQRVAPEALAGDSTAVAELEQVEARLAELDRGAELRRLAEAETAKREHAAAEAEAEQVRERWRAELVEVEAERDRHLAGVERALGLLVEAVSQAVAAGGNADDLRRRIDPNARRGRLKASIEDRLARRLGDEAGITELPPRIGRLGMEPLVAPSPDCAACQHDQRAELEEERAVGASLRVLEGKFGVSRSVLSAHFRDHIGT